MYRRITTTEKVLAVVGVVWLAAQIVKWVAS